MKVLVVHGPNLDRLGKREPKIYGNQTLAGINQNIKKLAKQINCKVELVQSNYEGRIVDVLGKASEKKFEAIIINPAAYTHTSVAIRDALSACGLPVVEVHLSNIYQREEFRHISLTAAVVTGGIYGMGAYGYLLALLAVKEMVSKKKVEGKR